jgi:hypothetical protein
MDLLARAPLSDTIVFKYPHTVDYTLSVVLHSSWDGWQSHPLKYSQTSKVWTVKLVPPVGQHRVWFRVKYTDGTTAEKTSRKLGPPIKETVGDKEKEEEEEEQRRKEVEEEREAWRRKEAEAAEAERKRKKEEAELKRRKEEADRKRLIEEAAEEEQRRKEDEEREAQMQRFLSSLSPRRSRRLRRSATASASPTSRSYQYIPLHTSASLSFTPPPRTTVYFSPTVIRLPPSGSPLAHPLSTPAAHSAPFISFPVWSPSTR